jgi:flavodoxin/NAD-dependent dihydropyrimidine dehydrogenase PreA subunit
MDVTIIYFSQTGSTQKVAEIMSTVFTESGNSVRVVPLKKATTEDATNSDLLGIGAPCFANQAPTPVKQFLRTLPKLNGKRAFVFSTSGGAPGRVLYDLTSLLRKKGMVVIGGFLTRGELHHPAPCMIGRMRGRPNQEDLARAQHFAKLVVEHISAGRSGSLVESRPDALKPRRGFYDLVGLVAIDSLLRLLLPEPKLNPALCDKCQWCVYACPMDNIVLQPYPVLRDQCIRCYRCLTGCPQKAFNVNWRFGNLVLLSLYNTIFERWFGDLEPGESIY